MRKLTDLPIPTSFPRALIIALVLLGAGLLFLALSDTLDPGRLSLDFWRDFWHDFWHERREQFLLLVQDHPLRAMFAVFLLHTALAALALPGASLLMLMAGAGFGALNGTLLCLLGCTTGASLSMLAARHFLQPTIRRRYGDRLAAIDARIARDGGAYLFSLRLLPVIPFAVVNIAAGLSSMRTWTFTWVSFVGMLGGTFIYVQAGTELGHAAMAGEFSPQVIVSLVALAIVGFLPGVLSRVYARRNARTAS